MNRINLVLCLCGVSFADVADARSEAPPPAPRAVTISLDRTAGKHGRFEAAGLPPESLRRLSDREPDAAEWSALFAVFVGGEADAERVPMLGTHSVAEGVLRFEPRFPLEPGVSYVAVLHPRRLTGAGNDAAPQVRRAFSLAPRPAAPPVSVTRVYPTADVLPENLLKFYLHFSAPMSQGEAYRHLHLLDGEGREIELPFLELGEELWNAAGTRLTILFDPGRIKRGVTPREEIGPALEEGGRYTLVIDAAWPDAAGRPLKADFRKTFRVGPPDDRQPDPNRWKVAAPSAGSRDPLVVRFEQPLDHAMLQRVLTVHDSAGEPVPGRIEIDRGETRWRFHPERAWPAGRFQLVAATILEDRAGNSIGRPFEVDVFDRVDPQDRSTGLRPVERVDRQHGSTGLRPVEPRSTLPRGAEADEWVSIPFDVAE